MKKHLAIILLLTMCFVLQVTGGPGAAQPLAEVSPKTTASFVDQLEIKSVRDAYGGASFGSVGPYRVISGIVHGKISPVHPANADIVGLNQA